MEAYQDIKQGERGAWVSIFAYLVLSAVKIFIGYTAASAALTADGLNNATDIVASVAVLIGLRISRRPPDDNHPYGHFRAETVAALVASFIMFAVGIEVLRNGVASFFDGEQTTPSMLAAWVALGCSAAMFGIYTYNVRLARRINNQALLAAAKDNRSDAWVSIGTFVGVAGSQLGAAWLDPLAATVVGVLIVRTAWEIFRDASHTLTDGYDDEEQLQRLKEDVVRTPGVGSVKDMKARMHGNRLLVDVTIEVASDMSVRESHDIAEHIERDMRTKHEVYHTHIHIEPDDEAKDRRRGDAGSPKQHT